MSMNSEKEEIAALIERLCNNLSATVSSKTGRAGVTLRNQIGKVRAKYDTMLRDNTFTTELMACFTAARTANVTLDSLTVVRQGLFSETPDGDISAAIIQAAITFCLSTEARMIGLLEFTSRDDVETLMKRMKLAFDTARDLAADALDSSTYQALTALAGSLTNHLSNTARPLPRMVTFNMRITLPALSASQLVYYDSSRWEELVLENKTIHPAFMQRELRGLSK